MSHFLQSLRDAAPYIHAHRGRTFVVVAPGSVLASASQAALLGDIALLHAMGVRVVLVFGARAQLEQRLEERGIASTLVGGVRVTDESALHELQAAAGALLMQLMGGLSQRLVGSPMAGAQMHVRTGNFVEARPMGLIDGTDFGFSGRVLDVDQNGIRQALAAGDMVLLPPLGFSLTGEVFNLSAHALGGAIAARLQAEKLVVLAPEASALRQRYETQGGHVTPEQAETLAGEEHDVELKAALLAAKEAVREGVRRAHVVDGALDGALLAELFSRDGSGVLVSASPYDVVRRARPSDIPGITLLLKQEASHGTVVPRTRRQLRSTLGRYIVVVRDGLVVATAALTEEPGSGLLAVSALAVHPAYRGRGLAAQVVAFASEEAQRQGLLRLGLRTTQTEHWFLSQGFRRATPDEAALFGQDALAPLRPSWLLVRDLPAAGVTAGVASVGRAGQGLRGRSAVGPDAVEPRAVDPESAAPRSETIDPDPSTL